VQKGLEPLAFIFALPHCNPLYEEFENPTPPPIIAFKQVILKLYRPPRLLIAFIAMPGPLPAERDGLVHMGGVGH